MDLGCCDQGTLIHSGAERNVLRRLKSAMLVYTTVRCQ